MSAPAAVTKYHGLSRLNTRHLFLPVLEAGKPNIKVPKDLFSGGCMASWYIDNGLLPVRNNEVTAEMVQGTQEANEE